MDEVSSSKPWLKKAWMHFFNILLKKDCRDMEERGEVLTKRLPPWAKKRLVHPEEVHRMKALLRKRNLHTVCESARCPNMGECFSKPTATFMILGDVCTRRCGFCSVEKRSPAPELDPLEPLNIALTAKDLGLRHVVVTSVTRDDLFDGGALQFALTIKAVREHNPAILIEVLTPDFRGDERALRTVIDARPDIFNHNLETVPSLYPVVRPGASYVTSLGVIAFSKASVLTAKSGIMVGLGEEEGEVKAVLRDLLRAGCDAVTIGQYLRPAKENLEVREYVEPDVFREYGEYGRSIGLKHVYSGPFVRSSYNAETQIS